MIKYVALRDYFFEKESIKVKRGDIFDTKVVDNQMCKKVFGEYDTTKEVNTMKIDKGEMYIIGYNMVACVLPCGVCSVVKDKDTNLSRMMNRAYNEAIKKIRH